MRLLQFSCTDGGLFCYAQWAVIIVITAANRSREIDKIAFIPRELFAVSKGYSSTACDVKQGQLSRITRQHVPVCLAARASGSKSNFNG